MCSDDEGVVSGPPEGSRPDPHGPEGGGQTRDGDHRGEYNSAGEGSGVGGRESGVVGRTAVL